MLLIPYTRNDSEHNRTPGGLRFARLVALLRFTRTRVRRLYHTPPHLPTSPVRRHGMIVLPLPAETFPQPAYTPYPPNAGVGIDLHLPTNQPSPYYLIPVVGPLRWDRRSGTTEQLATLVATTFPHPDPLYTLLCLFTCLHICCMRHTAFVAYFTWHVCPPGTHLPPLPPLPLAPPACLPPTPLPCYPTLGRTGWWLVVPAVRRQRLATPYPPPHPPPPPPPDVRDAALPH